ncbi:alpha/beta fold hydrolase [Pseudoflavonifractor sp. MSJ-37]|uniref:S9 family peptidase n=1 Tax=Pseudoflavonifractor sp. MSJ-37 TaxID=2841531 RepID=UPI001C10C573|nr:alpha/beta fold hydrolase [Pseudoflavonifractor sp. MSJ-37]MBU5436225.1 alpha/beta fold hydrolase [Pseudoflavonifractor sp. MSJ-37]
MKKKAVALVLTGAMALSMAAPALAAEGAAFTDVDSKAWYASAVSFVAEQGLMSGTGKGAFAPTATVTRAMVYQTLYNMAGKPAVSDKGGFTDISGKWYADAAAWAESTGLAAVPKDKTFNGERAITRAETAAVLSRYAKLNNIVSEEGGMAMKEAPDYDKIPAWALADMSFCYYSNVLKGDDKGNLRPLGTTQRAELAQILKQFSALTPVYTETVVSIDVPETDGIPAHSIPATVTMPASASKDAKVPGVVMLHGTGSNRDEAGSGYATAAPIMAASGIATIRIDFMGNGDSKASYTDYCYTSAKVDAKAAADYLAGQTGVDGAKLGVMGWSQGGTDALLAAAAYPDTFKAVVTWAGALDLTGSSMFGDTTFEDAYAQAKSKGSYTMTFDWRDALEVGTRWFQEVGETDMRKVVAQIKAPILAIQGEADTTVTPDNADKIRSAAVNSASDTHFIAGCDHTFNVFSGDLTALKDAVSAGDDFFLKQLGAAQEETESDEGSAKDYIAAHEADFFLTGKTSYTIEGMMVSKDTSFHNDLENTDYTAKDDGVSVVLKGTSGEQWVSKLEKVLSTYTKPDGSALTAADFTGKKDTFVPIKTKAAPDTNFACFVPAAIRLTVDTAWGDTLHVNDPVSRHGDGDYLVCANKDGKPDFSDVWVVNGVTFGSTYDTSRGPAAAKV